MFKIKKKDIKTSARVGEIKTDHGAFETPIFMPVATSAAIKGVHNKDLIESISPKVLLSNTYHLYLRPGEEAIVKAGGIHKFMSWENNIGKSFKAKTTALVKKLIKPRLTSCFDLKVSLYFFLISKIGVILTSLNVVNIAV